MHRRAVKLVFNLDEVGCSEWGDRREKHVIFPAVLKGCLTHHKVKRSTKHVTTLVRVTAAGDQLPPYLVISQKMESRNLQSGLVMGKYAVVA
jgi:hypothetical protein